jgi:hypothetical protein
VFAIDNKADNVDALHAQQVVAPGLVLREGLCYRAHVAVIPAASHRSK